MSLPAIKESESANKEWALVTWSGEAVVFCPQCKALQTVWLNDNKLVPTRKFTQEGNKIYHDCGSSQPCRLHIGWQISA